jgi:hypothetical protein
MLKDDELDPEELEAIKRHFTKVCIYLLYLHCLHYLHYLLDLCGRFTCAGGRGQHRAANGRGGVAALLVSDLLALLVLVVQADADNNGLLTVEEVFKLIVWSHDEPLYPDGNLI